MAAVLRAVTQLLTRRSFGRNPEAPRQSAAAASHSGCSDFQISAVKDHFTFAFYNVSLREIKSYHTWRAVYRRALLTAARGE